MTLRESAFSTNPTLEEAHVLARLDEIVSELSSTLLAVRGTAIDDTLQRGLQNIAEVLRVQRASLFLYAENGGAPGRVLVAAAAPATSDFTDEHATLPWYRGTLRAGHPVVLNRVPFDLPEGTNAEMAVVRRTSLKAHLALPALVAEEPVCVLSVTSFSDFRNWSRPVISKLRLAAEIVASRLLLNRQERLLQEAASPVHLLESDDGIVVDEFRAANGSVEIVGSSPALRVALERVLEVASTDATVLLIGETGTGKELFARALHERSGRRRHPLVRVNCAALPATLIESELFGHERGAFTGAAVARQGRFELADKGTLFLDEIGDLPLEVQVKLLRVLQEREFERLGSSQTRKVDVRLIAATNRDLEALTAEGTFRSDLFYRLNVFPIPVPSLSERREDIPRLVWYFVHRRQRALGRRITEISADTMERLMEHDWPGNVRELENVIERAMIRAQGSELVIYDALVPDRRGLDNPGLEASVTGNSSSLEVIERRHIETVLERCRWRINGNGNAAERLGLHPNTLRFRMKKLGISRPRPPGVL